MDKCLEVTGVCLCTSIVHNKTLCVHMCRLLDNCSHIILDEVHERDVLVDFLMIIIRDLLPKRFVLHVVLC